MNRRRCLGLAFGALWLTAAGSFFGVFALWSIGTPAVNLWLAAAIVLATASIVLRPTARHPKNNRLQPGAGINTLRENNHDGP